MTPQPQDAPPSKRKTAREVTDLLGETDARAYQQMRRILARFDREFVLGIYRQAVEVEASGGLLFEMKGGELKRRSLGGVFFWLAKQAMGPELTDQIIPSRGVRIARSIQRRAERKAAAAAAPPVEVAPIEAAPALPPKPLVPKKPQAVAASKPAKAPASTAAQPMARPAKPEASRAPSKRRGPPKMPEVFHTLRTK